MSQSRLSTWQKATALVPLALLSGAWTASLAGANIASAATEDGHALPDGSTVPSQAIEAPASVSVPGEIAPGVPAGAARSVISSASTNGIPSAALAAYQRAAQVINSADPSCKVSWQLIAAIGRVESDHGRYGGNTLSEAGKSVPGIYGIPLDGSNGTAEIADTDAGQYDDDPVYDRAVGPMQFIPSTWSVVGVDGDGDDVRDPQDIDDAALATAVYLCSGDENLSTTSGQRSSVYRYNHSQDYVNLVLSIMHAYLDGDYSAVPTGAAAPTVFAPSYAGSADTPAASGKKHRGTKHAHAAAPGATDAGSGGSGSTAGTGGSGSTGSGDGGSTTDPGTPTVPGAEPSDDPVKDVTKPLQETLSALDKAKNTCQANFTAHEIDLLGGLTACGNAVLSGGLGSVQSTLQGILDQATGGTLTRSEAEEQCRLELNPLQLLNGGLQNCVDDLLN
ncbi:MAG TPA: lytic murein transglycosylase [Nocardioidaceae bacterium]|nr:lytic murein transglycosylase [Nocardioidaceae bacterium]